MIPDKKSILDVTLQARGAFLLGCGGGGDIIQTIPVMNYLKRLGVSRFVLGEYAVKWFDEAGFLSMGCEVISLDRLVPSGRIQPDVALIFPETQVKDHKAVNPALHEAVITQELGIQTVSISLAHGAQGVLNAVKEVMNKFSLDLLITVDIGADSFYSGEETSVQSPMTDAISVYVTDQLGGIFALSGYGCDAELPLVHLDRNVARVMQKGGFLGAHGLTPQDVADLDRVLQHFPGEEVEQWPRDAALGKLGMHYCKGLWPIYVSPLAAVTLFFDPKMIMEVNPLPLALADTQSLYEAEEIIMANFNVWPETRYPVRMKMPSPRQPL
jgi:hypothetical protein